jgi:hypothetical protein
MAARRASAISLLCAIAFAFLAPFLADPDSNLPACCRKNGAHHCSDMGQMDTDTSFHSVRDRCPSFPTTAAAPATGAIAFIHPSESIAISLVANSAIPIQTKPASRVLFSRSRQKRGPPTLVS